MFYRNTAWAERWAAGQSAVNGYPFPLKTAERQQGATTANDPESQPKSRLLFTRYTRDDFESTSQIFWFYVHFAIIVLGIAAALASLVILISVYMDRRNEHIDEFDWGPLIYVLPPTIAFLVWMAVDGSSSSWLDARPWIRLIVEAFLVAGSTACFGLLCGTIVAFRFNDAISMGWLAALATTLGILVVLRLLRLIELSIEMRSNSRELQAKKSPPRQPPSAEV